MKKHGFFRFTQHLSFSLSLVVLTFVILNYFNPMLGFLSATYSQIVILLLCVMSAASSLSALAVYEKLRRRKRSHRPAESEERAE